MASASSTEQVPMNIEPVEPESSGTRQGETGTGAFDLLPRSENRPFQSPFFCRKGFTMEGEVDIDKELDKYIVVQVKRCAAKRLGSRFGEETRWSFQCQLSEADSLASTCQHTDSS